MKRALSILLVAILIMAIFTGCGTSSTNGASSAPSSASTASAAASNVPETAASSSPAPANPYATKESLVIGMAAEPTMLDVHKASLNSVNAAVQTSIFSTLMVYDSDKREVLPNVATSWEFTDSTTLKVVIRDDVYSHKGTHLTASDVVYSFKRGASFPALGNTFNKIDAANCTVIDDYSLNIKLYTPYSPVTNTLALAPLGLVCQADVEAIGDENFAANPVGTGPYVFTEWKTGESITLTRNEKYWGEKPQWKTLTYKFIPDANARALAVQSGDLDFAEALSSSQIPTLEGDQKIAVHRTDPNQTQTLWFNLTNQYLSNPKVREALELAIDRNAILQSVFNGVGKTADSIFSSSSKQYTPPTVTDHSYNVEKAKQMLKDAGYPDGFEVELSCYESVDLINILQIIQNAWAELGITCTIETMDKGSYFKKLYAGDFDVYTIHNVGSEPDARITFFDSRISLASGNLTQYANPEFDKLRDLAVEETDSAKILEYYVQVQNILRTDRPMIPLVETYLIEASGKGLTNIKIGPTSYIQYYMLKAE